MNLTQKIIQAHLVSGRLEVGNEIAIRVDQTLTQDATGTLSYLQFEATGEGVREAFVQQSQRISAMRSQDMDEV